MYALISDTLADGQKLPLKKALDALIGALGVSGSVPVSVLAAEGYGAKVNALDDATEGGGICSLEVDEIVKLVGDGGEWFYNLRATVGLNLAAFGVLDSSAVFVEGAPEIASEVSKLFQSVRVHGDDFLLGH